jgi:YD repeat-containing protein
MMIKEVQYKYDERNNMIEKRNIKTRFVQNNEPYTEVCDYNENNCLISKIHYDDKDAFSWVYTATYDAHNRLIAEETKNKKGKVTLTATYTYNQKGQLASSYNFDEEQKLPPVRIDYEYDKKGRNTVRYIYVKDAQTPTITKRYYYDDKGNWYRWWEFNHTDNTHAIANRIITYY